VAALALRDFGSAMDVYEQAITVAAVPSLIALGWFWRPVQALTVAAGLATWLAASLYLRNLDSYGADLAKADSVFGLKYFLSSQSAILWMSVLFFMSTIFYWIGALFQGPTATKLGSRIAWAGVFMALTGTLVRWFESHQIAPDIGHIPVSNLYEVFVLFAWLTTTFWLYYEDRFARMGQSLQSLGAFGWFFALVRRRPWRQRNPTPGSRPAKLVDEAACAGQLHWIWHLCHVGHGGLCLPRQTACRRVALVEAGAFVARRRGLVF